MDSIYSLARMIVEKKFPDDKTEHPFFICALYGILCKYKKYAHIVCDLFLNANIIMDNKSIAEILADNNLEVEFDDNDGPDNMVYAVANPGHYFYYDDDSEVIRYKKKNPIIICSLDGVDTNRLLNSFIHEMNHLIKGEINGYHLHKDDDKYEYYIRTGLAHFIYEYDIEEDSMTECQYYSYLDEAINVIESTEIMNNIKDLVDLVDDDDMLIFFKKLNKRKMSIDYGYEDIVPFIKKLWESEIFSNLVEQNIVTGEIETIIYNFNSILNNEYGFIMLNDFLDIVADTYSSKKLFDKIEKIKYIIKLKLLINRFKKKEKKLYKK